MCPINKYLKNSLTSNIWKVYLYRLLGSAVFTAPIWVLFLRENGLSLTLVMFLQAFYTIVMLFTTVPFGALADKWGRKYVLIISQIVYAAGMFLFFIGHNFWMFLIGEMLLGMATASFFGIQEAFIYDTLKQIKKIKDYKFIQSNIYAINDLIMGVVGMFGAAIAAIISMRFVFGLSILPIIAALFVCFSFKEPKHEKQLYEKNYFKHVKDTLLFTAKHKDIRLIISLSAILGSFVFATYFFYQVYFQGLGISLKHIGIIYAVMFAFSAIGAKLYHYVENRLKYKWTAVFTVGAAGLFLLLTSLTKTWWGIPLALMVWLTSVGFKNTFVTDYINKHVESHHRATVLSINNMSGNVFFVIISPIFGIIADTSNVRNVFLVMSIVLFVYLGYLFWYFRKK